MGRIYHVRVKEATVPIGAMGVIAASVASANDRTNIGGNQGGATHFSSISSMGIRFFQDLD
jgi:hypothetical protein